MGEKPILNQFLTIIFHNFSLDGISDAHSTATSGADSPAGFIRAYYKWMPESETCADGKSAGI
jgi:hypothetical protein